MRDFDVLDQATELVAAGKEAQALKVLHDALDAPHEPELQDEIHELAVQAHESSRGFHKIEWHRLMFDTERDRSRRARTGAR